MASFELPHQFAPFTVEHAEHPPAFGNGHVTCSERSVPVKGILEVEVHHAKNIHNICIYAKQDVYAKLSLISSHEGAEALTPTTTFCTEVVDKGGKDPVFNQKFSTSLVQSDCVLRCEVWMASKMRDYLQDQLLGVVSVPLSSLLGKGRHFNEYGLSSTELFHSPAGTISMTLEFVEDSARSLLNQSLSNSYDLQEVCNSSNSNNQSATTESELICGIDSKAVEFKDLADAREDEELVSDFITRKKQNVEAAKDDGIYTGPPFLKSDLDDEESVGVNGSRCHVSDADSPVEEHTDEHSVVVEGEAEKIPVPVSEKVPLVMKSGLKQLEVAVSTTSSSLLESTVTNGITPTPSSQPKQKLSGTEAAEPEVAKQVSDDKDADPKVDKEQEEADEKFGKIEFNLQPEPRIMQEEIMDMYMKSMQQFSEALAKMQLPVDDNGLIKLDEGASSDTTITKNKNNIKDDGQIKSNSNNSDKIESNTSNSNSDSGEKSGGTETVLQKEEAQSILYSSDDPVKSKAIVL